MRPLSDLFIIIGLFLLFLALGQGVVLVTLALWYAVPASSETMKQLINIQQLLRHPEGVWIIFYMQAMLAVCSMGLSSVVYRAFFAPKPLTPIQSKSLTLPALALMGLIMLVALPAINILVWWNSQIDLSFISVEFAKSLKEKEQGNALMLRLLTSFPTNVHFLVAIVVLGLVPAITEELWFRGILQNKIREMLSPDVAIWVTGFIFSVFHFQFEGFFARWLLGVLFGYLYVWSGNLWVTILGHFVNNFVTLLAIYLFNHQYLAYNFYEPSAVAWYWVLPSIVLTAFFIYLFRLWNPKPSY